MVQITRFYLTEKHFLSVGLNGTEPEIRLTSPGKYPRVFTPCELEVLVNTQGLLKERTVLASSPGMYGGLSYRICESDPETEDLKFFREENPDAQPFDWNEMLFPEFTLPKNCTKVFVEVLPKVKTAADVITDNKEAIEMAYNVLQDQLKRVCAVHPGSVASFKHFLHVMRILHQHIPMHFMVADFKRRSPGTMLNIAGLMNTVLVQFEYIYERIFPKCT